MSVEWPDIWGDAGALVSLTEAKKKVAPFHEYIPVFKWDDTHVWVFVKSPGGSILMGIKHKSVPKYAKRLTAPLGSFQYAGKLHPTTHKGPSDIKPVDWNPAKDALGGVAPDPDMAQRSPVPEFKPHPQGWETTGEYDDYLFPIVKHKKSGYEASWLPNGLVAEWDPADKHFQPLKSTKAGVGKAKKPPISLEKSKSPLVRVARKALDNLLSGPTLMDAALAKSVKAQGMPHASLAGGPSPYLVTSPQGVLHVGVSRKTSFFQDGATYPATMGIFLNKNTYSAMFLAGGDKAISIVNDGSFQELQAIADGIAPSWSMPMGSSGAMAQPKPPEEPQSPEVHAPGVEVPHGCTLHQTSPQILAKTALGDSLLYQHDMWQFAAMPLSAYAMAMNGAVYPHMSFTPSSVADPDYPGSLIGTWMGKPGYILRSVSAIMREDGIFMWMAKTDKVPSKIKAYGDVTTSPAAPVVPVKSTPIPVTEPPPKAGEPNGWKLAQDKMPEAVHIKDGSEWDLKKISGAEWRYRTYDAEWIGTVPSWAKPSPVEVTLFIKKNGTLDAAIIDVDDETAWELDDGYSDEWGPPTQVQIDAIKKKQKKAAEVEEPSFASAYTLPPKDIASHFPPDLDLPGAAVWSTVISKVNANRVRYTTHTAAWKGAVPEGVDATEGVKAQAIYLDGKMQSARVVVAQLLAWSDSSGYQTGFAPVPRSSKPWYEPGQFAIVKHKTLKHDKLKSIVDMMLPSEVQFDTASWAYYPEKGVWVFGTLDSIFTGTAPFDDDDYYHYLVRISVKTSVADPQNKSDVLDIAVHVSDGDNKAENFKTAWVLSKGKGAAGYFPGFGPASDDDAEETYEPDGEKNFVRMVKSVLPAEILLPDNTEWDSSEGHDGEIAIASDKGPPGTWTGKAPDDDVEAEVFASFKDGQLLDIDIFVGGSTAWTYKGTSGVGIYGDGFGPASSAGSKASYDFNIKGNYDEFKKNPELATVLSKLSPMGFAVVTSQKWGIINDVAKSGQYVWRANTGVFTGYTPWEPTNKKKYDVSVQVMADIYFPTKAHEVAEVVYVIQTPQGQREVVWYYKNNGSQGFMKGYGITPQQEPVVVPDTDDLLIGFIEKKLPKLIVKLKPNPNWEKQGLKSAGSMGGHIYATKDVEWVGKVPEELPTEIDTIIAYVNAFNKITNVKVYAGGYIAWSLKDGFEKGFGPKVSLPDEDDIQAKLTASAKATYPEEFTFPSNAVWDEDEAKGGLKFWRNYQGTFSGKTPAGQDQEQPKVQLQITLDNNTGAIMAHHAFIWEGSWTLAWTESGWFSGYGQKLQGLSDVGQDVDSLITQIAEETLPGDFVFQPGVHWTSKLTSAGSREWRCMGPSNVKFVGVAPAESDLPLVKIWFVTAGSGVPENSNDVVEAAAYHAYDANSKWKLMWFSNTGYQNGFGSAKTYAHDGPEGYKNLFKVFPPELEIYKKAVWTKTPSVKGSTSWTVPWVLWNGPIPATADKDATLEAGGIVKDDGTVTDAWVFYGKDDAWGLNAGYGVGYGDGTVIKSTKHAAPEPVEFSSAGGAAQPSTAEVVAQSKGKLPSLSSLKIVKGKGGTLGGAGKKDVFTDGSTEYIWKPAIAKGSGTSEEFRGAAQSAFSTFATAVRPGHIRIGLDVDKKGQLGTLQEMIPLGDPKDLMSTKPKDLSDQEKLDVATEHMLDWVMSQHDSHPGNLVRTADGRILSIDKEQGWKYFKDDRLDTEYHPNSKYGEKEPFYNTFWRDFKDGKFDFDPSHLASIVTKMEAVSTDDYVKGVRQYADLVIKDPIKRSRFMEQAVNRKLNVRRDFETFITDLMRERKGERGAFTFDEGWISDSEKDQKKYITKQFTAQEMMPELGIKEWPHDPGSGANPTDEPKNPDWTVLKLNKDISEEKLQSYLEEFGLELVKPVFTGPAKHIAIVTKASISTGVVTKKVPKAESYKTPPSVPKYWPDVAHATPATGNVEELKNLEDKTLGRHGHRITSDGSTLEGQTSKVARWKSETGEVYYRLVMKLRKKHWSYLKGGESDTYYFKKGKFDTAEDMYVELGGSSDSVGAKRFDITAGGVAVKVYIATGKGKYAYMGGTYIHMPATVKDPLKVAKAALNKAKKGLGNEVFKPMTEEDEEVLKLSRVLWAMAPQKADALKEDERTVSKLKLALKGKITKEQYDAVESIEVFPGYHSQVMVDRWKEMGDGAVRFAFNGISGQEAALSILKTGLMGIHERNLAGIPQFGGSYSSDVQSGSGDGILARVITANALGNSFSSHNFHGQFQVIIHPKVLDRLDAYMHPSDKFGRCRADSGDWTQRKSVEKRVQNLSSSYSSGNEISFRRGVHKKYLLRMTTSNAASREKLIAEAIAMGITKVNGVPLTDFVVVCTSLQQAYDKYVKPLGLR